ncbi:MAG: SMC-Scp complex subunit ScpB [Rhodospirillaceae bacterium]|nr:SMC-Scp complex subunit ScpB [Rhodospirillaceae bacterium]
MIYPNDEFKEPVSSNLDGSIVEKYNNEIRLIEALLFASQRPLQERELQERLPPETPIVELVEYIREIYKDRGINIIKAAGGWAFRTAIDLKGQLRISVSVNRKLSTAAVETMAIIAYHQPVTRGDIEAIRGVAVSRGTLDTLLEVGWIRPRGRRKVPGRPLQWGTTDGFLDHFNLESLNDLPGLEELKAAGLLDRRESLTSLILPDDTFEHEGDEEEQNELFSFSDEVAIENDEI